MLISDFQGNPIRLPDERVSHILRRHRNISGMEWAIPQTLQAPDTVRTSRADPQVRYHYRWYTGTVEGDKYLCVVVKLLPGDAFVLTAYLTSRIRGRS